MLDLWEFIEAEAVPVKWTHTNVGARSEEGLYVPGATTTRDILAVVQPARGVQLLDLPEGMRATARLLLWSKEHILLDDDIQFGALSFRVILTWPRAEGGYTRAALGLKP